MGFWDKLEDFGERIKHSLGGIETKIGLDNAGEHITHAVEDLKSGLSHAVSDVGSIEHEISHHLTTAPHEVTHTSVEEHTSHVVNAIHTSPVSQATNSTSTAVNSNPWRILGASHPELNESHPEHHSIEHEISHAIHEVSHKIKSIFHGGSHKEASKPESIEEVKKEKEKQMKEYNNFVAGLMHKAETNPFYREELKLVAPQIMQQPKSTIRGYEGNPFEIAKTLGNQEKKAEEKKINSIYNKEMSKLNEIEKEVSTKNNIANKEEVLAIINEDKAKLNAWKNKEQHKINILTNIEERRFEDNVANEILHIKPNIEVETKHKVITPEGARIVLGIENAVEHTAEELPALMQAGGEGTVALSLFHELSPVFDEILSKTKHGEEAIRFGEKEIEEGKKEGGVKGFAREVAGYSIKDIAEHPLEYGENAMLIPIGGEILGVLGDTAPTLGNVVKVGILAQVGKDVGQGIVEKNPEQIAGLVEQAPILLATGEAGEGLEDVSHNIDMDILGDVEKGTISAEGEGEIRVKKKPSNIIKRALGITEEERLPIKLELEGEKEGENTWNWRGIKAVGDEEKPIELVSKSKPLWENIKASMEGVKLNLGNDNIEIPVEADMQQKAEGNLIGWQGYEGDNIVKGLANVKSEGVNVKMSNEGLGEIQGEFKNIEARGLTSEDNLEEEKLAKIESEGESGAVVKDNKLKAMLSIRGSINPVKELQLPTVEDLPDENFKIISEEEKPSEEEQEQSISQKISNVLNNVNEANKPAVETNEPLRMDEGALQQEALKTATANENDIMHVLGFTTAVPEALFKEDLESLMGDFLDTASVDTANIGRIGAGEIMAMREHDIRKIKEEEKHKWMFKDRIGQMDFLQPEFRIDMSEGLANEHPLLNIPKVEEVGMIAPTRIVEGQAEEQNNILGELNALSLEFPSIDETTPKFEFFGIPHFPLFDIDKNIPEFPKMPKPKGKRKSRSKKKVDKYKRDIFNNKIASVEEYFGKIL